MMPGIRLLKSSLVLPRINSPASSFSIPPDCAATTWAFTISATSQSQSGFACSSLTVRMLPTYGNFVTAGKISAEAAARRSSSPRQLLCWLNTSSSMPTISPNRPWYIERSIVNSCRSSRFIRYSTSVVSRVRLVRNASRWFLFDPKKSRCLPLKATSSLYARSPASASSQSAFSIADSTAS